MKTTLETSEAETTLETSEDENYARNEYSKVINMNRLDNVFTLIFTFEMVLKVLALGTSETIVLVLYVGLITGKNSYFKNPWNILDFFIVETFHSFRVYLVTTSCRLLPVW